MGAMMVYSPWGNLPGPLRTLANDNRHVARDCRYWQDGRCEICGSSLNGYAVEPMQACPALEREAARHG